MGGKRKEGAVLLIEAEESDGDGEEKLGSFE